MDNVLPTLPVNQILLRLWTLVFAFYLKRCHQKYFTFSFIYFQCQFITVIILCVCYCGYKYLHYINDLCNNHIKYH